MSNKTNKLNLPPNMSLVATEYLNKLMMVEKTLNVVIKANEYHKSKLDRIEETIKEVMYADEIVEAIIQILKED